MTATHEKIKEMRINASYSKHNKDFWSKENDKELKKKYNEGYGISEIALEMGRTENSIAKRIKDLKLDVKRYNTKRREPKQKGCICGKCYRYQKHECNGSVVAGTCCTDTQE